MKRNADRSGTSREARGDVDHFDQMSSLEVVDRHNTDREHTIAERALKKVILHRKNALFYKTPNGAHVGDLFMSIIHTTEQAGGNSFDYLTALLSNPAEVAKDPQR